MKKLFLLTCTLYVQLATAQYFEWASTSSNLFAGYKSAAIDASGNLVCALDQPQVTFYNGEDSYLYDATGTGIKVNSYQTTLQLVSYSPSGSINWTRKLTTRNSFYAIRLAADGKGNIYLFAFSSGIVFVDDAHFSNADAERQEEAYDTHFICCYNTKGDFKWMYRDEKEQIDDAETFEVLPSGDFIVSGSTDKNIETKNGTVSVGKGGNYVLKMNEKFEVQWANIVISDRGRGTRHLPAIQTKVADDGNIYSVGTCFEGMTFSNGQHIEPPAFDSAHQYNMPFESYLIKLSPDGNLKWTKTSGSKVIFSGIGVSQSRVYLTGNIVKGNKNFGMAGDTTDNKKMLLMCFDTKGNAQWIKTTKAEKGEALVTDLAENVYVFIRSKVSDPANPLLLGPDTVAKSYERFILASYDMNGNYRWYKKSNIMMSTNERPTLLMDRCNNIFAAGEMWYVLKVQTSIFDGVFVKGDGYGAAPFAAKIKNSIERESCRIAPGPWKLMSYPNPAKDRATFRVECSSDDETASLMIYDMTGKNVANVFKEQPVHKGKQEFPFDAAALAPGRYVAVLKGAEQVATADFEIVR